MIKPVIPADPTPPDLSNQLSPVVVITAEDVSYYAEACDAWVSDEYNKEEMENKYPGLSRSAACDWAIYGQTVQGNLNLENIFILQATYAQQMREHVKFLREIIDRMYTLSERVRVEAAQPPPKPEKKWYQIF